MKKYIIIVLTYIFSCITLYANVFSSVVDVNFTREDNVGNIKEQAFARATQQAFKNILYKIILDTDIDGLQELLEEVDASKYVFSFTINNEDVGRSTYKANISFVFNSNLVVDLLKTKSIRFVDKNIEKNYVIIPYFSNDGVVTVNNVLESAFNNNIDKTLSNFTNYSFVSYSVLNSAALKKLESSLNANGIFVIEVAKQNDTLTLNIKNHISSKVIYSVSNIAIEDVFSIVVLYVEARDRLNVAINSINVLSNEYYLKVTFGDFNEYLTIIKHLKSLDKVKSVLVSEFGNSYVNIQIISEENLSGLSNKLAERCVNLQNNNMILTMINNCNVKT